MDFVERILAAKGKNTLAGTSPLGDTSPLVLSEVEGLEEEIDELVYALYGLSEEEIGIVEGV